MRSIPATLDSDVVTEIDRRLEQARTDHHVTIPWAIESGSRAWGFPSPDSDYDCRFFFVRSSDAYLSPWPLRDVIETPLDKIYDVNGWDLAKAVRLLVKGNAVVTEWLRSAIVYTGDDHFRSALLALAEDVADPTLVGRHYLHVARKQWSDSTDDVALKRVFYAMRPAASLRWLRMNPTSAAVPPMNLTVLLDECAPSAEVAEETARLIELKSVTREVGRGAVPSSLAKFINDELVLAEDRYEDAAPLPRDAAIDRANEYFRKAVAEFGAA